MSLRQKQKAFEALKKTGQLDPRPVSAELDADLKVTKKFTDGVAASFTDYRYRSSNDVIRGGLELLALGNAHKKAHYLHRKDTHYGSTARQFKKVAQSLGFEQVARFRMHRDNGRRREHTYVLARPDGLILTWNTYGHGKKSANDAKLYFQSNDWPKLQGLSGGKHQLPNGGTVFAGSFTIREGLRETVTALTQTGGLRAVWAKLNSFDASHICTMEQDYGHQRERKPALTEKDFTAVCKRVEEVNSKRLEALPLWVKQMTGEAPLRSRRGPQPA